MSLNEKLDELKKIVVDDIGDDLISLYAVGSILNPQDMTSRSDIDLWGIVKDDFDFKKEDELLEHLRQTYNKKYNIEGRFRAITHSELYGGSQKGLMTKYTPITLLFRNLLHGHLIYGQELDLSKSPVKIMDPEEEAKFQIESLEQILFFRKIWYFRKLLKLTNYLAKVEGKKKHGYEWEPGYEKILDVFSYDKTHIIHLAEGLRKKENITEIDMENFTKRLEDYIEKMKDYFYLQPK
jgi:hypothetical protein